MFNLYFRRDFVPFKPYLSTGFFLNCTSDLDQETNCNYYKRLTKQYDAQHRHPDHRANSRRDETRD